MYRVALASAFFVLMCHFGLTKHYSEYYYCEKNYCPTGKPNVGCGCKFNESYAPGCGGKSATLHKFTRKDVQFILHMHNHLRNLFACGSVNRFFPAVRMVQLRTDDDLQSLAECNVKNCTYGHDQCRSTEHYHYAGQNIAKRTVCGRTLTVTEVVNSSMYAWFDEYWDTRSEMLAKYPDYSPRKPIGHFTLLVNDNVFFIGCAMVSYAKRIKDYFEETGEDCRAYYFVCNYSFINLKNRATYTSGMKPATMCQTHHSKQYPCLCSVHEPYSTSLDWQDQVL
ncbi:antigen 5 like allergen Cul n 1-like [Anopheles marshallii]|uniref:antigen 5 like allergen Cul n 1-like n=1 Tax=Anopheles marshallii TaxID=1521116 RepID=UPI00237A96B3|nr:antigen 5 like allergen Cul n 1-like [Anopheles marshallii]